MHALTAAFAAKSAIVDEKAARIAASPKQATTESLTLRRHHTDDAATLSDEGPARQADRAFATSEPSASTMTPSTAPTATVNTWDRG